MSFIAADARLRARQRRERLMRALLLAASMFAVAVLGLLLSRLLLEGLGVLAQEAFWRPYSPLGLLTGRSGVLDAIITSLIVLTMTLFLAIPIGTAAGVYLHEYTAHGRLAEALRTTVANLAGVPSVVYGLLGLAVFVRLFGFGATNLSSALTLAVLILPIVIVATEEALRAVPNAVREASYALGATKWQTVRSHVLPYALPSILTGQILALSRAAGETAPLLLLGIPTFTSLTTYGPMAAGTPLQVRIYGLTQDPRSHAHALAAGAVVVLLLATLLLNLAAVWLRHRFQRKIRW